MEKDGRGNRIGGLASHWLWLLFLAAGTAQATNYVAPRLAGSAQPNINGIWQALNSASYDLEMHTAKASLQVREGPHGDVPAVQTLFMGAVREVYMQDPGEAPVDSWMGWSAGRWEGDTLVVAVTGQYADTWLDRAGNHHSDQLKVTERYTPLSPFHLQYEATLEVPQTYIKPWTIRMPLYRRMEADAQILEFKCVEFVEELMFGKWRRKPLLRRLPAAGPDVGDSR